MSDPMTIDALRTTIYDTNPRFWRRYPALLDAAVTAVYERFKPRVEIL